MTTAGRQGSAGQAWNKNGHLGSYRRADEIYRGAELDDMETNSLYSSAPTTIVTGGMAKSMGLAGLRIGWILAPEAVIQEDMQRQDYTTMRPWPELIPSWRRS